MNAPVVLQPKPMRHVQSDALVDFAEIYDERVEVVSVTSAVDAAAAQAVETLLGKHDLQAQWVQTDDSRTAGDHSGRCEATDAALTTLRQHIGLSVEVLRELLGCQACGVRLQVLEAPMCPRFHVDKVPCRMLMTYAGPGTEWIAHQHVDPAGFASGDPDPTLPQGRIQQLPTGAWSLLKGGTWHDGFDGVVHRSPSVSERRLLVSLDPIFND